MSFSADDTAIVLGSSRSAGNTRLLVDYVLDSRPVPVVDLAAIDISVYDYRHANSGDGFLPLIETLLEKPLWLLATPVYWYTMSAQMKVFLDRLSDLITIRKDLGRKLRGKSVAVITCGVVTELPEGFEAPFRLTCAYLGMEYLATHYAQFDDDDVAVAGVQGKARDFGALLFDAPGRLR